MKNIQCPVCGEYIPADAIFCEYCGEKIAQEESVPENKPNEDYVPETNNKVKYIVIAVLIFALAAGLAIFLFHKFSKFNNSFQIYADKPTTKEQPLDNSKSELEEGKLLLKEQKYEKAAEIFQKAIDKDNDPTAYYYMGEVYNEQGFSDMAIENYKKAVNNKKNFFEPLLKLALLYYEKGNTTLALEYGESAFKIKQNNKELLTMLAKTYEDMGNSDKAMQLYKKLVAVDPKNYDANYYIVDNLLDNNKYKEAIPYLQNMLKNGYDYDASIGLAVCYIRTEYYTKAIEVLDTVLSKNPYDNDAYRLKAMAINMRDDYKANQEQQPEPPDIRW